MEVEHGKTPQSGGNRIVQYLGGGMALMGLFGFTLFLKPSLLDKYPIYEALFALIFALIVYISYKAHKDPIKYGSLPLAFPVLNKRLEKKNLVLFLIVVSAVLPLTVWAEFHHVMRTGQPLFEMLFIAGWGLITIYGLSLFFQVLIIPRRY